VSAEPAGRSSLEAWFAAGARLPVELPETTLTRRAPPAVSLFTRVTGAGPWMTLLHGFPTCSWDWAPVAPALAARHRLLLFDFLGFGDSDKPAGHAYRLGEQADLTEALWRRHGITATTLVAHDYGVSVAQELLARRREGRLAVALDGVAFLNGGIIPGLHRPLLIQKLLATPGLGWLIARLLDEARFRASFTSIFAPTHPPSDDALAQHWAAITRRGGKNQYHRLIRYMDERRRHAARWVGALEASDVPLRFVWGERDPISGAHVLAQLRARLPRADFGALADVGHYPQLEAPERVAAALLRPF